MSLRINTRAAPSCSVALSERGVDLHWLLDDGKTHVIVLKNNSDPGWYIVNRGMRFQEGPFDTGEAAVTYCNLRYTPVVQLLEPI